MDPVVTTTIFPKFLTKCLDCLFDVPSKILRNKHVLITQEDKDELISGLGMATLSIRYALKNHIGKRQLTFRDSLQQVDVGIVTYWLYDYFLDFYYATLNKKIIKQIEIIYDLHHSISIFYCYSHSFNDNSSDSAYSIRYQQSVYSNCIDINKAQKIADEIFEITLPNLLKSYIKLTKLLQKQGIIN